MPRYSSFFAIIFAVAALMSAKAALSQQKQLQRVPFSELEARHKPGDTVAIVNGVLVSFADFTSVLAGYVSGYQTRSKDTAVSDSMYTVLVDSAWDRILSDIIVEHEIETRKLELSVSAVRDSLVEDPPAFLRQEFTDSTGTFRRDLLRVALNDPRNDTAAAVLIDGARVRFETERLISSATQKHPKNITREKAFEAWLEKAKLKAKIVDRRVRFGLY